MVVGVGEAEAKSSPEARLREGVVVARNEDAEGHLADVSWRSGRGCREDTSDGVTVERIGGKMSPENVFRSARWAALFLNNPVGPRGNSTGSCVGKRTLFYPAGLGEPARLSARGGERGAYACETQDMVFDLAARRSAAGDADDAVAFGRRRGCSGK